MEQEKAVAQPPPQQLGYMQPWYPPEDEISLIDLWRVLVKQKRTIIGVTALVTLIAIAYALLSPSIYRAESLLLPPTEKMIAPYNLSGVQGVQGVTVEEVFDVFKQHLNSRQPHRQVFNEKDVLEKLVPETASSVEQERIFEGFAKGFKVAASKAKEGTSSLTLSLEGADPEWVAEMVNRTVQAANRLTIAQIAADLETKVGARKQRVRQEIFQLRKIAAKQRQDEITRLNDQDQLERSQIEDQIHALRAEAKSKRKGRIQELEEAANIARSLGIIERSAGTQFDRLGGGIVYLC